MFFVLSGFCLAWGPLTRQASGAPQWFSLRRYAIARCRRILPPYYAALVLYTLLNAVFVANHIPWIGQWRDAQFSVGSIVAHVFLIQNVNPHWLYAIDGPMWSLATEWQWYCLFPVALLLCSRWPLKTLTATLIIAIAWFALMMSWPSQGQGEEFVPGRLFEFCCGILAARLLVSRRRIPAWMPLTGVMAWVVLENLFPSTVVLGHVARPLDGVLFGSLVLLAGRQGFWYRVCSTRALAWVGLRSYSVYLIHVPIVATTVGLCAAEHAPGWLGPTLAVPLAVGISAGFFEVFERPWLRAPIRARQTEAQPGNGVETATTDRAMETVAAS